MNPYYIVKQALQETPTQRYVHPLAQIEARQMGVNPMYLVNREMEPAMAQLTNYATGTPQTNYINDLYIAPQPINIDTSSMGSNGKTLNNKELETLLATSSGYNMGTGTDGAWNAVALSRTLPSEEDNIIRIMNSPRMKGTGTGGTVDINALLHKIVKPIKWKGAGKFALSMNKFQNIFNPENIGKFGRNGGESIG